MCCAWHKLSVGHLNHYHDQDWAKIISEQLIAILLILTSHEKMHLMKDIPTRRKRKLITSLWRKHKPRTIVLLGISRKRCPIQPPEADPWVQDVKTMTLIWQMFWLASRMDRFTKRVSERFLGMFTKPSSLITWPVPPLDARKMSNAIQWWTAAFCSPFILNQVY